MNPWLLLLIGYTSAALLMAGLWWITHRMHKADYVDAAWAAMIALQAILFACLADSDPARRMLVGILGAAWGLRLAVHLYRRISSHAEEDGRYAAMRRMAAPKDARFFFVFFQVQAFWATLFAAPMLGAMLRPVAGLDALDFIGAAIWLIAVGGEWIADRQLAAFKRQAAPGQVCRVGLWSVSRHPNYFFEWVHWWAYIAIGVTAAAWGWLTLAGPFFMLLFLFTITGIAPTEINALKRRGELYRRYQDDVSPFLPWFARRVQITTKHHPDVSPLKPYATS